MFGWFKNPVLPALQSSEIPLSFKDTQAAFKYACDYLQIDLKEGVVLPALVLDAAAAVGGGAAVRHQPNGIQIAMLRVCAKDGGYMVIASSASANGPALQPGDLVAWQAGTQVDALATQFPDPRSRWSGLILARLLPEYTVGWGWAIHQPFKL